MFYKKQCLRYLILASLITSAEGGYAQSITTTVNNGLNTNVNQVGNQYNITGGTQAGANLFYSLQKLGLSTGEIANFLSNSSVQNILTRVTGGEASLINGLIQVTGGNSNLFILNPAGIVFGANASLNIPANFSATTASGIQVGNGWFGINSSVDEVRNLTGNVTGYGFTNTLPSLDNSPSGVIVNQGNLSVSTGKSVTLVGGMVVNTGTIATSAGKITIAATPDNKFIKITNEGSLISLELPIADQQVVGNAPVLRGVDLPSLLIGKTSGTAIALGNLDVSGNNGGTVQVLGDKVSLVNANINANGINGGGTVLIGGDLQGNGTTPKSLSTTFDASSTINADALVNGNGGKVVVWSDGTTAFDGTITAKAGTLSGNGGLVETSGKNVLTVGNTAQVNTSALQGETGTWLLDPTTITVVPSGGTDATVAAANANAGASTINNSTIVSALNGTDVNLTATNAITVNAAINSSANASSGNLALTAPTTNLNAPITLKAAGSTLSGNATTVNVGALGTVQNGVDATAAGGTVNLAPATYTLGSTVAINKSLTVNGAGANNTTVSGNNAVRVFDIIGANVTLNGLSIVNGNVIGNGGGINHAAGTLNISNTTINNNTATQLGGGIYNGSTSVITNITNSTISNNRSTTFNGGGIQNEFNSTLNITNSTISSNSATGNGGGIRNFTGSTTTLNNVTIANNTASNNGGGISNTGTVNSKNTIIAQNTNATSPDVFGTFTDQGSNLIGKSNGSTGFTNGVNGNIVGTIAAPVNPLLGALANNGGSTQTHALSTGSPAINAGNNTGAPATDQRGAARPPFGTGNGTNVDIGAYEVSPSYIVTRTADNTNTGSLRTAINFTNTYSTAANQGTILFQIPTTDTGYQSIGTYWSIAPTSALPSLTKPVIIDGYSQTGATPNTLLIGDNAKLAIELNGTNAGATNGLTLASGSSGSTVKGLAINGFSQLGIWLQSGSDGNTIAGNFIGTDITGTTAKSNYQGIYIQSANNIIGGTTAALRNIISGNLGNGVFLETSATNNLVQGNYIGTDKNGTVALPNGNGVELRGSNNTIGGSTVAARNIISGNIGNGIYIPFGDNNKIQGNYIGVDVTGNNALGNQYKGIHIQLSANNNIIGTDSDGVNDATEGNVISANRNDGITIDSNSQNTKIAGNLIGTNATGTTALGNALQGIYIITPNNIIGGTTAAARNIISGNQQSGVFLDGVGATNNTIQGNYIGTDVTGTQDLGNQQAGILINNQANTNSIRNNTISGNDRQGGAITASNANVRVVNASNNTIAGNFIGTNATGTGLLTGVTNGGSRGILISNGSSNNTIGGMTTADRNIISGNLHTGIEIIDAGSTLNTIINNYIGTNVTGTQAIGNGNAGIQFYNNPTGINTIGAIGAGNLISGNGQVVTGNGNGIVFVSGSISNNTIQSNFIGTDVTGNAALSNTGQGIYIQSGINNIIGGTVAGAGNIISGNRQSGIYLDTNASSTTIQGNYIGTNVTGTTALGNTNQGIYIRSANNIIGGTTATTKNIISGNQQRGVFLDGAGATGNKIQGNYIGTNITGTSAIANALDGVLLNGGATNNIIGTDSNGINDAAEGNLISGNGKSGFFGNGIYITGTNTSFNIVAGNKIGTDINGTSAISNQNNGIGITFGATNNRIGGTLPTERNLISGNNALPDTWGIWIGGANNNVVQGNYIGTDISGTTALANGTGIVLALGATSGNLIGGNTAGAGNLISGNNGISFAGFLGNGIVLDGSTTQNNTVQGNLIGTNATGNAAIPNTTGGVAIQNAANNNIINQNVISGNTLNGIIITGANTNANSVTNNKIGTQIDGTSALANSQNGVLIAAGAKNNIIGGTVANTGNAIAFNSKGVTVTGNTSTGNQILGNSIFSNTGIGIDLNNDGITVNGVNPRTFPNSGQNYPLLLTASGTNVSGVLNSAPSTTYRLEFFASDTIDQGKTFLGTTNVITDASGIASFSSTITSIPAGQVVTATATNATTGTSEFSATPGITITATAGTPQSTTVNQAFATPLQATVKDSRGNPAANGVSVTFAATTAVSGATSIFTSGSTVTTNNSIATAPIKANTVAGTYTAIATATGAATAANFGLLTNNPDVPALITATSGTPQSTVVNTAFANQLQVLVKDQFGNVVPNSTVTFTAPNTGASTAAPVTTATTDANGVAKVSITANTTAGTYNNTATSGAATAANFNLTNNPDVPALITATSGTPQSTVVNTAFGKLLQVTVKDQFGNLVPNSTVTFTAPNIINGASGKFTGTVVTITATTDLNGIAQVPITANNIFGSFTSTAKVEGVATAANFNLTNQLLSIDDPELLRQHKNAIARLFLNQQTSSDFNFNTKLVAFLSTDDIEFQRLDRFLIIIVEYMNKDGGTLAIDTKDIWKDADISIFDQSINQDVIKVAIRRSIGKFIGNEYIDLVDINFEPKKDKKLILLKVRKSPKPAKYLKG